MRAGCSWITENWRTVRHVNSYRTHKLTRSIRTAHTSAKARLFVVLPVPPYHNRFTALFPGPPGWAGARTELLDFMVQGKINRGRHTDHPAGRHSIRTNQCHLHHPAILICENYYVIIFPPNEEPHCCFTWVTGCKIRSFSWLFVVTRYWWVDWLRSPYVIGQTIIFLPCYFYLLFSSSFFPSLISAAAGWMSTILWHMVWP